MKLAAKVAIVTGGGSGIGRAICITYANEGGLVVAADLDFEGTKETAALAKQASGGDRVMPFEADVTIPEDIDRMVTTTIEKYGHLDILVNNAGVSSMGTVDQVTFEDWRKTMSANLDSVFLVSRRAIPEIQKVGKGRVINISSAMGLMAHKMACAYSASKAGNVQLTREMAMDYGCYNITVNTICPGIIETPLTLMLWSDKDRREFYERTTPLQRLGTAQDVANLALFLASDEADFITGVAIPVDGGIISGTDVLFGAS